MAKMMSIKVAADIFYCGNGEDIFQHGHPFHITIDIMSIVGSLLFGVRCGAFTAVSFFSDEEEITSTPKADALFIPRKSFRKRLQGTTEFDDVEGKKNSDQIQM
ncbi:hypothetical protein Tco_0116426 [Tanacetum coccineum]